MSDLFPAKSKKTENVSTVGVDVSEWMYPSQAGYVFRNNRPTVTFSTWDFGGQVIDVSRVIDHIHEK